MRLVVADGAVLQSEQRPVTAHADILAGMELGAALTNDDAAGDDGLAAEDLDPKTLRVTLAAVGGCSLTFFMRHDVRGLSDVDGRDLDDRKLLAMALLALVTFAFLLLEHDDLVAALVLENGGRDRRARQEGLAHLETFAFARGEDVGNLNGRTGFRVRIAVHHEDVPLGDGELLALGLDGRSHK